MKTDYLKELKDHVEKEYSSFQIKLTPGIKDEEVLGVRSPYLKDLAKRMYEEGDYQTFLNNLPHKYYEENNLHAFILNNIKDYDDSIKELDKFLPYVNNWSTCDYIKPKAFNNNHNKLIKDINRWLKEKNTYSVRFAIEMLMKHYLTDNFKSDYLKKVAKIKSDEYYIKMMQAWFFAEALVKKWDETINYIEDGVLDAWVHNKTIQKAIESYRINDKQKMYLRSLKR